MSPIKNPHIIHMVEDVEPLPYYSDDPGYRYLCIHACFPIPSKSTRDPTKVTCKNCLRAMAKIND